MEVWLGTDNDKIRFPVVPSSLGVSRSADIKTNSIIKLGEVSSNGGMKLKTSEITSFFPNQEYSFCNYRNFMRPYEFSEKIQRWMYDKTPVRLIITGTPTNLLCYIADFDTNEQDGTRDLYFSLKLIEYKKIYVPQIGGNANSNNPRPSNSNGSSNGQRSHKVVKGDNLWDIAHKYYGRGSDYHKIKNANTSKYPSLKNNNIIYPNWVLIIP
nr:MAG TPA: tail assembly protein [Caudoviricetes sp.]